MLVKLVYKIFFLASYFFGDIKLTLIIDKLYFLSYNADGFKPK